MGNFREYEEYDGLGLAELIRKKEVRPEEVLEAAISRIESANPHLNAVIYRMDDLARKAVKEGLPTGPFSGVPFLLKDLLQTYAGVPLTNGSMAYRNHIPDHDSELVIRFKKAGVVPLGKTNCPEFGLLGITEPELHGPTRNPWDTGRTPGGSSGGSAAAVAAGMVPLASAGDGGGSIRIPASHCGLFGLKPTRDRTPNGPDSGSLWQGAVAQHVISRSVRDSAAMLDAVSGTDGGAPYVIPSQTRPYMDEIEGEPGSLTIAFNTHSPVETDVHPECTRAVEDTAQILEELGHHVEEARPDLDGILLAKSYMAMYFGEVAADIEDLTAVLGRKARRGDVEELTWILGLLGRTFSSGYLVSALRHWGTASRVMGGFMERYDLYLTPTVAYPPVKIGELQPKPGERIAMKIVNTLGLGKLVQLSGLTDKMAIDSLSKTPFTQLANLTGLPAMSVPLHWTEDGLPIGTHFMGRFGDEATLFRLAAQLEKAKPWFNRRPPMSA